MYLLEGRPQVVADAFERHAELLRLVLRRVHEAPRRREAVVPVVLFHFVSFRWVSCRAPPRKRYVLLGIRSRVPIQMLPRTYLHVDHSDIEEFRAAVFLQLLQRKEAAKAAADNHEALALAWRRRWRLLPSTQTR